MILIGDVAFETRDKLNQCRQKVGDEWDDEEIYFVFDELRNVFPRLAFTQISYCARHPDIGSLTSNLHKGLEYSQQTNL